MQCAQVRILTQHAKVQGKQKFFAKSFRKFEMCVQFLNYCNATLTVSHSQKNSWSCQYFQALLPRILLCKVFSCALEICCKFHGFLKSSTNHAVNFPSSKFNVRPLAEEACSNPSFRLELVNGSPRLAERNHKYYDQIQGQLAQTGATWCDFIIYTSRGLSIESIPFDKESWNYVRALLHRSCFRYFLPAAAKTMYGSPAS